MKNKLKFLMSIVSFLASVVFAQPDGKKLYEDNCTVCHKLDSKLVGPALMGVTERRPEEWLIKFIRNSKAVIESGDEYAVNLYKEYGNTEMTSFQNTLNEEEVKSIIEYLKIAKPEAPVIAETPKTPQTQKVVETPMSSSDILLHTIVITVSTVIIIIMIFIMANMAAYMSNKLSENEKNNSFTYKLFAVIIGDWRLFTGQYTNEAVEDHIYDGIQELDNRMPPWLQGIFYVTIAFAIIYMINYHVINPENTQQKEYENEMEAALLKYGDMDVVKIPIELISDNSKLAEAKEIYIKNCAVCHGNEGQGTIGPNLTDEYWLHGGSLENVFGIIRKGVPGKPMEPWKGKISDENILAISSYIKSLKGSNPQNPKAAEGEKYTE